MKYKLLALDLDETTLNSERGVSERTLAALHAAEDAGVVVAISTGRAFSGAARPIKLLGLKGPVICFAGAQIYSPEGTLLYKRYVEPRLVGRLLRYANELGCYAQVYLGDDFCYEHACKWSDYYVNFYGFPGVEIPKLSARDDLVTPKVLFADEPENTDALMQKLHAAFPEVTVCRSRATFIECLDPLASKGIAVKYLAERLGIESSEVMAAGDNGIDRSMLEYAGLSVAVANALPEIKAICDYIAPSNDDDGVAVAVEKFILGGD